MALLEELVPGDWVTHNDLAVALLERSRVWNRPIDAIASLEHAMWASELAPLRPEPRVNVAVVLDKLAVARVAESHLEELRTLVDGGYVSMQVREVVGGKLRHLAEDLEVWKVGQTSSFRSLLGRGKFSILVARFPNQVRVFCETENLDDWIAAKDAGAEPSATIARTTCLSIGDELGRLRGDHLVSDLYRELELCELECENQVRLFRSGVKSLDRGNLAEATRLLASIVPLEGRATIAPLAGLALYYRVVASRNQDLQKTVSAALKALKRVDSERYPTLAARMAWRAGILKGLLGAHDSSVALFLQGISLMEESSGEVATAFGQLLLAEEYEDVGDEAEGWRHRLVALQLLQGGDMDRHLHSVLNDAVSSLTKNGRFLSARLFSDEMLRHARESGQGALQLYGHIVAAELAVEQSEGETAMEHLFKARALTLGERPDLNHTFAVIEASSQVPGNPDAALILLEQPIEHYRRNRDVFHLLPALLSRCRAHLALGDIESALRDFYFVLDLAEEQRSEISTGVRLYSFRDIQAVGDRVVSELIDTGRSVEAFGVVEQLRGRFLGEVARKGAGRLVISGALSSIDSGTAVVFLSLLNDEDLSVWLLADGEMVNFRHDVPGLRRWVKKQRFRLKPEPIEDKEPDPLYELLVRGVVGDPLRYQRIVFVPDRWTSRISFGAMLDVRTGRYLVELVPVAVAPSMSLFLRPSARSGGGPEGVVLFGAPDLAGTRFSRQARLPGAAAEVSALRETYPLARYFSGPDVTEMALVEALMSSRIVHFAGHSIAHAGLPLRSSFPLSKSPNGRDELRLDHLLSVSVRAQLIVLSSCETADGFEVDGEGTLGFASSLFALGADAVLGVNGALDDWAGVEMTRKVHRGIARGERLSTAFHLAVVQIQREGSLPVEVWAQYSIVEANQYSMKR